MRKFKQIMILAVDLTRFKTLLLISIMLLSAGIKGQNIGINATGAVANASAMLDIVSTTKGLLIPRMTHHQIATIAAPATGLLAYSTDTIGFYYYDGTTWVPLLSNSLNNGGWSITGNSGTTPSSAAIGVALTANSNFIGTTGNQDFIIGTNNYERIRVTSSGNVGISNKAPAALLDIGTNATSDSGYVRLEGSTSGYVGLYTASAAGSWNMKLPPNTGTSGQVLTTDGTGITTWTTAVGGGGVTSVSGTAPIYVTNPTTAPVVWIHGAAGVDSMGSVLYSTGTGSSALFNAIGNAPSSTDTAVQVLVSQGTAAPTWNNIGGTNMIFYRGCTLMDESTYTTLAVNTATGYFSTLYGAVYNGSSPTTQLTMPKCVVTRVRILVNANSLSAATTTFMVMHNNTTTSLTNTLAHGSTATVLLIDNPTTFADGDTFEVRYTIPNSGTGTLSIKKIEVTYYPLP